MSILKNVIAPPLLVTATSVLVMSSRRPAAALARSHVSVILFLVLIRIPSEEAVVKSEDLFHAGFRFVFEVRLETMRVHISPGRDGVKVEAGAVHGLDVLNGAVREWNTPYQVIREFRVLRNILPPQRFDEIAQFFMFPAKSLTSVQGADKRRCGEESTNQTRILPLPLWFRMVLATHFGSSLSQLTSTGKPSSWARSFTVS